MAYKQSAGRGSMQKTGAGIPSALLQKKTDEKAGTKSLPAIHKGIHFEQDPNLSKSEDALVSQKIVNKKYWKENLETASPQTFDAKMKIGEKAQRAKDSTYIVNNRVHRFGPTASSLGTNLARVTDADKKDLKHTFGSYQSNTGKFKRDKSGNVRVYTPYRRKKD